MACGGMLGLIGVPVPGVEIGIAVSGVALGAFILGEVQSRVAAILGTYTTDNFLSIPFHVSSYRKTDGISGLLKKKCTLNK